MANQFQSIQAGLGILKNYYQGPIVSQFNDDVKLWRGSQKGSHPWSGLQVVRPLKARRNQGIGATSDGGPLPAIGKQTVVQATIPATFNYLRFGITGPMIKASQSDLGSFVRSASYELMEGYQDLKSDMNRQLGWDGTGTLAQIGVAAVASTSLSLIGREAGDVALRFVDIDQVLDLYNGTTLVQAGIQVVAITSGTASSPTAVITVNVPVTASVGYTLVRSQSGGNELDGILYQLDGQTTTKFAVNRALYPQTQGNYFDFAQGQLSLDKMQQAYNEGLRRGAGKYSVIWTDFNTIRMYNKLLVVDKRYVNTTEGDGSFTDVDVKYMEFGGVPMMPDKDFPTRLAFIPEESIVKYILCELEFADETGSMMIAQIGTDALEARIRFFANLFNEKPAASSLAVNYISP